MVGSFTCQDGTVRVELVHKKSSSHPGAPSLRDPKPDIGPGLSFWSAAACCPLFLGSKHPAASVNLRTSASSNQRCFFSAHSVPNPYVLCVTLFLSSFFSSVRRHPKISFTLSKNDEPRSAGLLSTLSVAPSCSISFRWSRVSFDGVSTRTW